MNRFVPAARTLIVMVALAAASVGCKQATAPATTDSTVVTTVPATPVTSGSDTSVAGTTGNGAMADKDATHASSTGSTAGSNAATHAGAAHDAGNDRTKPMPAVRNNSGETQGTAPTSLPTSDGSR